MLESVKVTPKDMFVCRGKGRANLNGISTFVMWVQEFLPRVCIYSENIALTIFFYLCVDIGTPLFICCVNDLFTTFPCSHRGHC